MLQLQAGCKGHIVLKAQRCGTIRMIGAITITYIASSRLQDSRVREIEKARSRAWNRLSTD